MTMFIGGSTGTSLSDPGTQYVLAPAQPAPATATAPTSVPAAAPTPVAAPAAGAASPQAVAGGGGTAAATGALQGAGSIGAILAELVAAVQQLTAIVRSNPAAATLAGGPAQSSSPAPVVQPPVQQSPVQQSPVQQAPGQQPAVQRKDGPGVYSKIVPKAKLEQEPELKGKLDPPTGGKPPKGVKVQKRADGTRVMTINIHDAAPKGKGTGAKDQDIRALRDVARYINAADPDVVMVQELNDLKGGKVPHAPSVLAHLIGATDMAHTPGRGSKKGDRRDSGTYTRNGFRITQAVNVDLPDKGDPARRSAGVAVIQPPDGGKAFTAVSTHLSHRPDRAASQRRHDQMQELARVVNAIQQDGSFTYREPGSSKTYSASGFPQDRIVLGGDLNTTQGGRNGKLDSADAVLGTAQLKNANDLYGKGSVKMGIDHVYAYGFDAVSMAKNTIARNELPSGSPTDHPAIVTDLV